VRLGESLVLGMAVRGLDAWQTVALRIHCSKTKVALKMKLFVWSCSVGHFEYNWPLGFTNIDIIYQWQLQALIIQPAGSNATYRQHIDRLTENSISIPCHQAVTTEDASISFYFLERLLQAARSLVLH
jgi:hypothetical protein